MLWVVFLGGTQMEKKATGAFIEEWKKAGLAERFEKTVAIDRKSTRLNSSHITISYAVFCLEKKKHKKKRSNFSRETET